MSKVSRRDHDLIDVGISSIAVPMIPRNLMFVEISGKLHKEGPLTLMFKKIKRFHVDVHWKGH